MTAYQIGYMTAVAIIVCTVPAILLTIGHLRSRKLEREAARKRSRPYRLSAWIVGFPLVIWAGWTFGELQDREPSVDQIMAGVDSGCRSSCVAQDTLTETECDAYCTCMSEPLRRRLAEDPEFREIMSDRDPAAIVQVVVRELADEIRACLPTRN